MLRYSHTLLDRAKKIEAIILDFDGVWTNNQEIEGIPYKPKGRSHYDGQGVSLLRAIGVRVCIETGASGEAAAAVTGLVRRFNDVLPSSRSEANPNGWHHVHLVTGVAGEGKVEAAEQWLKEIEVSWNRCAAMGDDLVDVPLLRKVGFAAAPCSAEEVVRDMCDFVTERPGGYGAVRDLANLILASRDIDPTTVSTQ